ncbi:MAG: penicillin-binding protein activator [Pseudomonadota bacterium]
MTSLANRPTPRLIAIYTLALFLAACGAAPPKPDEPKVVEPEPEPDPGLIEEQTALPASEHASLFNEVERALAAFDHLLATATLVPLESLELTTNDRQYLEYLQASIAYQQGEVTRSREQLDRLSGQVLHPGVRYRVLESQRQHLALTTDYLGGASVNLELARRYPDSAPQARQALWQNLARMDRAQRLSALRQPLDAELRGYIELADIADAGGRPVDSAQLVAWQSDNAQHPAASRLPAGLDGLEAPRTASRAVLILPLSGRLGVAGRAVRDGYLAAYYQGRGSEAVDGGLTVLDRTRYSDSREAYQAALALGADLIIGPLSKTAVADLAMLPQRPVTVLALNRLDTAIPAAGSPLLQLSLSPEDEVARVAELAFGSGARRALLVRPEGEWGDKVERALRERFQPLGGVVASAAVYRDPEGYSSGIEGALGIPDSKQRAQELRAYLGVNLEFTARRRYDIDAVFLLTRNSAQARAIKPLLAYHYAGDLPVWGISSSYSGGADQRDRDLSGLRLVEMPWLLENRAGLQQTLEGSGDSGAAYKRLNALGAEAYLVQRRLGQLDYGAEALIPGHTGLLRLDPAQRLLREPSPAKFDGDAIRRSF